MLYPLIASILALICGPLLGFCGTRAFVNITKGGKPHVRRTYAAAEILAALLGFIVPLVWLSRYVSGGDESVWVGVLFLCAWSIVGAIIMPGTIGLVWCLESLGKVLGRMVDRVTLHRAEEEQ